MVFSGRIGFLGVLLTSLLYGGSPQIWFEPLDDITRQESVYLGIVPSSDAGPTDYMDLFSPGAPWAQAASHVSVFKLYLPAFSGAYLGPGVQSVGFSDSQLQQIFSFLKEHNIALGVDFGPLTPSSGCGAGVEGFNGPAAQLIVDRIQANGGTLSYVMMDEPFQHASDACNWTAQQVATNALTGLNILKSAFPGLVIGDAEPVPDVSDAGWLQQYAAWMDAFQAATGSKLGFFDCDTAFVPTWINDVASLRTETSTRAIPLGIIYNGRPNDLSNAEWITHAQQNFTDFELSHGQPDRAIFQSWTAYPTQNLPETTPYTFTWLIDQYALPRPSLSLNIGGAQATGKLVDAQANGIGSAPVGVTMQPTSGGGVVATYTLTGTVPAAIGTGLIQICVNQCGTQGTNNMSVYSLQYADSGSQVTLNFSKGLAGWGIDGNGTASVQLGSDANGPFLSVSATAAQSTFINSPVFTVTPGSAYTLTVTARISPDSIASGYFAPIFLSGPPCPTLCPASSAYTEVSRDTLDFAPGTVTLGTAQTASDGSYSLQFTPLDTDGMFQATAYYAGSAVFWPAEATAPINLTPSISANGIVNGADFKAEALSPGAWFTIFGQNLGSAGEWTGTSTINLGGAAVSVCGISAVLSYNSGRVVTSGTATWQLNALVPTGVAGQASCPVIVTVGGEASQPANVSIKAGIMELFAFTSSAGALPVVTHSDYSLVGPVSAGLSPAAPGEEVVAWGTGDCALPSVTVGNANAAVLFSGTASAGLCQINFSVPDGLSGANQLQVSTSANSYILWVAQP